MTLPSNSRSSKQNCKDIAERMARDAADFDYQYEGKKPSYAAVSKNLVNGGVFARLAQRGLTPADLRFFVYVTSRAFHRARVRAAEAPSVTMNLYRLTKVMGLRPDGMGYEQVRRAIERWKLDGTKNPNFCD